MAGEQKRSHCFVKKNEEKSIRPQHLAPRRGMGRKIRTSAEKTLGKGMSPYGREVKQTTQTLRQGAKSSVSQRGRQWHSRGRGDVHRMDWNEAEGGRNGQNQAHTKKVDMNHGLSGGRREEIGRLNEQKGLMRNSPGLWIVRTWRGCEWRHWRDTGGRKEEGEEFHETKKRVVKAGVRKHCKHTKLRSPAPTNGIFFVSGEVKGIALFWLRSPLFCLQLLFSCMQYSTYFREVKISLRMAIIYITQVVLLLHQALCKQQLPG